MAAGFVLHARRLRLALARAVATELAELAGAARPDDDDSSHGFAAARSRTTPQLLDFARALGRARLRRQLRAVPRRRRRRRRAIPISTPTTGCGAARSTRSSRPSRHGVRAGDDEGHQGSMPAFGRDGMLKRDEISAVADYVRSLSGLPTDAGRRSGAGAKDLRRQLRGLPRPRRQGQRELGAPNLTDKIWLYGRTRRPSWRASTNGRGGVMPAWGGKLDDVDDQGAGGLRPHVRRRGAVTHVPRLRHRARACTEVAQPARHSLAALAEDAARTPLVPSCEPDEPDDDEPLYAARKKVYPQSVTGTYRRDQMGSAAASRSASIICCRSCAGTAARTRRARRC